MDLDTLKKSWQKLDIEYKGVDERRIKEMISKSSNSVLSKIRQNMFIDLIVSVIGIVAIFCLVVFYKQSSISLVGLIMAGVLFGLLALVYPRFYKHSKKSFADEDLKSSLQHQIDALDGDAKFYRRLNGYLYPLAVLTGLFIDQNTLNFLQNKVSSNDIRFILIAVILALAIFPVYQWFVKWWANKMYGRFVDQLKAFQNEFLEQID